MQNGATIKKLHLRQTCSVQTFLIYIRSMHIIDYNLYNLLSHLPNTIGLILSFPLTYIYLHVRSFFITFKY